jgi:hypothetical protein
MGYRCVTQHGRGRACRVCCCCSYCWWATQLWCSPPAHTEQLAPWPALQEQRNILAIAVGLKGIAAIRAVLNWAPVQAHATSHRVTAYYVTKSPSSAAFLSEWDQWREAGVSASFPVSEWLPLSALAHIECVCTSVLLSVALPASCCAHGT